MEEVDLASRDHPGHQARQEAMANLEALDSREVMLSLRTRRHHLKHATTSAPQANQERQVNQESLASQAALARQERTSPAAEWDHQAHPVHPDLMDSREDLASQVALARQDSCALALQ